jgi:hypothetical protein
LLQDIRAVRGTLTTFVVTAVMSAWAAGDTGAGNDGAFLGSILHHPPAGRSSPYSQYECFQAIAKAMFAANAAFTTENFERVASTPAYRGCLERKLMLRELAP